MDNLLSGLKSWMGSHVSKFIGIPVGIQVLQLMLDFMDAASDGVITQNELVALFDQNRGIESGTSIVMLVIAMVLLKLNKGK